MTPRRSKRSRFSMNTSSHTEPVECLGHVFLFEYNHACYCIGKEPA